MIHTVVQETWLRVRDRLREEIGTKLFDMWFGRCSVLSLRRGTLTLGVPNLFIREWIEEHYSSALAQLVSEELGASVSVTIKVDPSLFRQMQEVKRREMQPLQDTASTAEGKTYEGFLVDASNETAAKAVRHLALGHEPLLGRVLIYGSDGTGKSHLASAAARLAPVGTRLYRLSGEDFARRFSWNLKTRRLEAFRSEIARADLLILDDIQDLANKQATQRELLGALADLKAVGGRVLVFSENHPSKTEGLEPSLVSALLSGMVAELQPQGRELKVKVIQGNLRASNRKIPRELVEAVVARGDGSVKRLDRLVRKVYAFAGLTGQPVDERFLDEHLEEIAGPIDPKQRRHDLIFGMVVDHFGVTKDALLSKKKTKSLVMPRAVAVFLLREQAGLTFKEIGTLLGGRSHTSVYLMHKKYSQLVEADVDLSRLVKDVGRRLLTVG